VRPTLPWLITVVPVCFERCATKKRQYWCEKVERCDECNGKPHNGLVYLGEVKHQQPCADGPFENCNANDVDNLCNPEIVRIAQNIDRWIIDMSSKASIDDNLVNGSRSDIQKLQESVLDLRVDLKWVRDSQWR
jgi:hypothetical protein